MADVHSNNSALTAYMIFNKTRANSLTDVRTLNMWGYNLKDVSIFQQMPNVEVVSLSMNEISTLRDFSSCMKLRELLLRHNTIQDLSEIQYLSNLRGLKRLWLAENPIASQENYRNFVISTLPQLEILDEIPITEDERKSTYLPKIPIENHEIPHRKRLLPEALIKLNKPQNNFNEDYNSPPTNRRKQRLVHDEFEEERYEAKKNLHKNESVEYGHMQNFNFNQPNNDEAQLTAVLALLPGLSANSISIVLDAISKLSESN